MKIYAESQVVETPAYMHIGYLATTSIYPSYSLLSISFMLMAIGAITHDRLKKRKDKDRQYFNMFKKKVNGKKLGLWLFIIGFTGLALSIFVFNNEEYDFPYSISKGRLSNLANHYNMLQFELRNNRKADLKTPTVKEVIEALKKSRDFRDYYKTEDIWENPIKVKPVKYEKYTIYTFYCAGKDKKLGTVDDMVFPSSEQMETFVERISGYFTEDIYEEHKSDDAEEPSVEPKKADTEEPEIDTSKATLKQKWEDVILSEDELKKLYEISKNETFENIAQILLNARFAGLTKRDKRIFVLASAHAPDWRNRKHSMSNRKKSMANEIWSHFVRTGPNPDIAAKILDFLRNADTDVKKRYLIMNLMYDQWIPEAEDVLHDIANNKTESIETRILALNALNKRCDIDKYISLCIDVVNENTKTTERCVVFHKIFNFGNRFFKLKKENAKLILRTGFQILIDLNESDYRIGYSAACTLGVFVKIESHFRPNQKDEKYKRKYGVNEVFFTDTVRNAIKWYEENKIQILAD